MKRNLWIILVLTICVSCTKNELKQTENSQNTKVVPFREIPDTIIDKSTLIYKASISRWMLNDKPYSGHVVRYSENKLIERFSVLDGRKQNQSVHWFPDGHKQYLANYHEGLLYGEKKTWSADSSHILISHLNYVSGKAHGEQKKWYPTGELFKKLHLNMGREEGIQQAFRKNGDLFANYEAKNGRIFGLKKAALCFGLEDEKLQDEK